MILNKYMQNKKDISAVGGYGNLDILKILLALLIVLRHIGQWFLFNNVFWHGRQLKDEGNQLYSFGSVCCRRIKAWNDFFN